MNVAERLSVQNFSGVAAYFAGDGIPGILTTIRIGWLMLFFLFLPLFCTVPSSVTGVTVNNSGRSDYLSVSWLPASGDVDSYLVTLSHDDKIVQTLTISKSFSECSFSSLTPGTLYDVMITTKSGKYENYSFSQERTGKERLWASTVTVTIVVLVMANV